MEKMGGYTIVVGAAGAPPGRRQDQATDLADRLTQAGIEQLKVQRSSLNPQTMAVGEILTIAFAAKAGRKLLDVLRNWLASRRTEIEIQTADGQKIRISTANFDEAIIILDRMRDG